MQSATVAARHLPEAVACMLQSAATHKTSEAGHKNLYQSALAAHRRQTQLHPLGQTPRWSEDDLRSLQAVGHTSHPRGLPLHPSWSCSGLSAQWAGSRCTGWAE